jgi:hypothetical protein
LQSYPTPPSHNPLAPVESGGLFEEVPTIARKLLAGLARRLHEADASVR